MQSSPAVQQVRLCRGAWQGPGLWSRHGAHLGLQALHQAGLQGSCLLRRLQLRLKLPRPVAGALGPRCCAAHALLQLRLSLRGTGCLGHHSDARWRRMQWARGPS